MITFLLIILLIYILYKFFNNIDNNTDTKSIKIYVDNLKKEYFRYPTTFGSGRDYIITKFNNFLTNKQCDTLINIANKNELHESYVYENGGLGIRNKDGTFGGSSKNLSQRISEQTWVKEDDKYTVNENNLLKRITLLSEYITGIPKENQEEIQVVKYEVGGYFKEHYDACEGTPQQCHGMNGDTGQRITTLLIYLNDNIEGGVTKFTNIDLTVKPVKGMAILFYNVSEVDLHNVHPFSKHTGTELIKGQKWVANIWSHSENVNIVNNKSEEFIKREKIFKSILDAPPEECKCPNCPNPDCKAKKETVIKCRMKKCPNQNCPNYYLKHSICQCPHCENPYCQSKKLKECMNPLCKNRNCPNAQKRYDDIKRKILNNMPK